MATITNKGDVKKIVIGSNSYTIYDESARTAAATAQTTADGKVDASYVTTQLANYVTTSTANTTYAKASDLKTTNTNLTNLTSATNPAFKSVTYDSTNHEIVFGTIAGGSVSLDASAFIKDGMLTSATVKDTEVEVEDSSGLVSKVTKTCLVLTVKIDNGNGTTETNEIVIPIEKIFNADNYYTKTEITTNYYTKEKTEEYVTTEIQTATADIPTNSNVKTWISTAKSEAISEAKAAIPTKVSAFTNDSGYITTCFVSYDATEKMLTLK